MATFGIGAKLKQERIGRGFTIEDVARETRIKPRFLEAIEADDFEALPGLVFARNFVRQFALSLKLDPEPLVAALPKPDESTISLPDPPARSHTSYQTDRRIQSGAWLVLALAAVIGAWVHFNRSGEKLPASPLAGPVRAAETLPASPAQAPPRPTQAAPVTPVVDRGPSGALQVVLTAHQPVWVQVVADGKNVFMGTLQPDETKEIAAMEQVKLVAGNAGGLTVSLNGKTLDPIGSAGQVRVVRLTAAGPEFLASPQPAPDPL